MDYKESWVPKNWCFWTVVLKKTLESPLDSKGIKPVNPKGNQLWIFIGRTDAEAEDPILWPPATKTQLTGKIEGRRRSGRQTTRWSDGITDSMDLSLSKSQDMVKDREAWHAAGNRVAKSQTQLSDWTTTTTPQKESVVFRMGYDMGTPGLIIKAINLVSSDQG